MRYFVTIGEFPQVEMSEEDFYALLKKKRIDFKPTGTGDVYLLICNNFYQDKTEPVHVSTKYAY